MSDAVPLDILAAPAATKTAAPSVGGWRSFAAVFVIFLFVASNVFVDHVLAGFRGAVEHRTPTAYGTVLQGLCLVALYAGTLGLIDAGYL